MNFNDKLQNAIGKAGSVLCVGLDPDPAGFPPDIASAASDLTQKILGFCAGAVEATQSSAGVYKINTAFYEALGPPGFEILGKVKSLVPQEKIVIADAKRGDISNTAEKYKTAFFDVFDFDAITLSPLMGFDTLEPFLQDQRKAVFVLTLTSNPGAEDFFLKPFEGYPNLSTWLSHRLRAVNADSNTETGMVVGATQPDAGPVLQHFPESNLLIPGIGAQGGSVTDLEQRLKDHKGIPLISVSRCILKTDPQNDLDWKDQLENQAQKYHQLLENISLNYV